MSSSETQPSFILGESFLATVQAVVERHHAVYPYLPPQGVFFEALVEQAFRLSGRTGQEVIATTPNRPCHDLLVGGVRLSIKSETGKATRQTKISITKLCTTETGPWTAEALVGHALAHIDRHDLMLMLRAIWCAEGFAYQLLEIPLDVLRKMRNAQLAEVGVRPGRRSVAGDVVEAGETLFRVHFDGADGKCQIHRLLIKHCRIIREWNQPFPPKDHSHSADLRNTSQ